MEPTSSETMMVRSLQEDFGTSRSTVLLSTDRVKVVRLSLKATETIKEHRAHGPLVVHCLEGKVDFPVEGKSLQLCSGDLLHLARREPHSVHAIEDSVLLLTVVIDH